MKTKKDNKSFLTKKEEELIEWTKEGNLEEVKKMVEKGVSVVALSISFRKAYYHGKDEIIKYLIEQKTGNRVDLSNVLLWADFYKDVELKKYVKKLMLLEKLEAI